MAISLRRGVSVVRRTVFVLALTSSSGCLVVTVNPTFDRESLLWDPQLVGDWYSPDDNVALTITAGEWQSYTIEYVHPIEKGRLTGHLTSVGKDRFLDVMPARGEDRGSFVLPLHVLLKVNLAADRFELTPLSYDWFFDRLRKKAGIAGLDVSFDQKDNALIVSPTAALRRWVQQQSPDAPSFGASAVFMRKKRG